LRAVVVALAVLKNLLQRARPARREDDAVRGDGDESVFAQAVLEILADLRREGRRRLVSVIPGRHSETFARSNDGGAVPQKSAISSVRQSEMTRLERLKLFCPRIVCRGSLKGWPRERLQVQHEKVR
jgi:hypothetical protein